MWTTEGHDFLPTQAVKLLVEKPHLLLSGVVASEANMWLSIQLSFFKSGILRVVTSSREIAKGTSSGDDRSGKIALCV
jgi:hypothetical protein